MNSVAYFVMLVALLFILVSIIEKINQKNNILGKINPLNFSWILVLIFIFLVLLAQLILSFNPGLGRLIGVLIIVLPSSAYIAWAKVYSKNKRDNKKKKIGEASNINTKTIIKKKR